MAGWSSLAFHKIGKTNLLRNALASKNGLTSKCLNSVPVRTSGHGNSFMIKPGAYRYLKLLDVAHLYFVLGALPLGALVLYCNIFIGPAKLTEIPEGYVPKHWEYYEHPITRWIAKMLPSPQESYEKELHKIHIMGLKKKILEVEGKVEEFMKERDDYQAWYYVDTGAKYSKRTLELTEPVRKHEGKVLGLVV